MATIPANTWIPTGNDYVIDGEWGRLGFLENFGETTISGAINGLAIKEAGDRVFLYAGSVNGGIYLRIYVAGLAADGNKATDSWGDSWEWISNPGGGYTGSQSIGALSISEDGKYIAVGQGNPSNYLGKDLEPGGVGAPSQGVQIGAIQADGSVEWLPVANEVASRMRGRDIRALEWVGNQIVTTSWERENFQGHLNIIDATDQGLVNIEADLPDSQNNSVLDYAANHLVLGGYKPIINENDELLGISNFINIGEENSPTPKDAPKNNSYNQYIASLDSSNQAIARVSVYPELVEGKIIAFVGAAQLEEDKSKPGTFDLLKGKISNISRLVIDPASREIEEVRQFDVPKNDIGDGQSLNLTNFGNFSLQIDPYSSTGHSVFAGGNYFGKATTQPSAANLGGLVRVDFSGEQPSIAATLYGPKFDTNKEIILPFSPGQPHADSRSIAFYESATGPRLVETDDGGIWEVALQTGPEGSTYKPGTWWKSLTTKGINTLETNMVSWASASNSIASSYQDNAASLGYFGDDHATNLWQGDGQHAFFDDATDGDGYSGYLSSQNYLKNGWFGRVDYTDAGFITSRQDAEFYVQRAPGQVPVPWEWTEEGQKFQGSVPFFLPAEANAYQSNRIVITGYKNFYETTAIPQSSPETALVFRPLLPSDSTQSLKPTAIDNQGHANSQSVGSLYIGAVEYEDELDLKGYPAIYGRVSNSSGNHFLEVIDLGENRDLFRERGQVVDLAHTQKDGSDILYWLQGGKSIASKFTFTFTGALPAENQILSVRETNGNVRSYSLKDLGLSFQQGDTWGYQALAFVPGNENRPDQLVLAGLTGIWSAPLDDQGLPAASFQQMPWYLPDNSVPGSYVRSIQYDPQDDLLIAGTQGQGGYLYSFSGDLGERPASNELLHISNVKLPQRTEADLNKRGQETDNEITIQLDSRLQDQNDATEIEIILHDANAWRESMEVVSLYTFPLDPDTTEYNKNIQLFNLLTSTGLERANGKEESGDLIIPFTFPAGVSLYNLVVNQKEFASPRDKINLEYSVRTTDGASSKSAQIQLIPNDVSERAVFYGSTFNASDSFKNKFTPDAKSWITNPVPLELEPQSSPIVYSYTITPSASNLLASQTISNNNHATRTTIPIDAYRIQRETDLFTSKPKQDAWLFSTLNKSDSLITYDPTSSFGARFYDLSGDGYADRLSITANASQTEFSNEVELGFGSVVMQPRFSSIDRQQVLIDDGVESNQTTPFNIRISASLDLDNRPTTTSNIGYVVLKQDEDLSNTLFKERSKTLITSLGSSVDLSAIPDQAQFQSEILINTGQRVMFFELDGASLDQLTGVDDPRLSWFETEVVPEQNGKTLALSKANQTALTVNITPGVQGINPLIADLQNQAPILDFTAFATDQTITGTLAYGREAALDSSLGWYVISRADGAITAANGDTLLPGHASYTQEALRANNLVEPLTGIQINDREIGSKDFSIKGGRLLAPYAKVSNGETYFAFAAANSDGLEHFYSLGTNKIGFEDLKGGGDRDFQDLVQMFDFNILNEPAPLVISGKQTITDKSLIGTEDYPDGPTGDHFPIYWPGTQTSKIIINDQPGVIKDIAVAFALTSNSTNDTGRIFVTLISPSGVRIPIAGTTIDPKYLSYRDTTTEGPTTFGLQLRAGDSRGYLYAETEESIAKYSLDNSIKGKISQETSSLSLASLTALTGAQPNGVWQLEVKNSSDASIQLDNWQLLLKSEESNTKTDSNGDYRFESISPSTTVGPITPWITLPSDRELISPTGKLNAGVRLAEQSPIISFGLSTKGSAASATEAERDAWSRFDLSTLTSPDSLLPKTTLSQAVTALEADSARAKYGINGEGIKIGLLSSTWNQLGGVEWDYKTGVLNKDQITLSLETDNAGIEGHKIEGNDEGRSMAQLIHSIAPGAEINFHSWDDGVFRYFIDEAAKKDAADPDRDELIRSAFTNYDKQVEKWREALITLAEAGCRIMVDDLDDAEPWFQDGGMTQAISEVIRDYGVTYFTAGGNYLNNSYTSVFNGKSLSDLGESSEDFNNLPARLQQELRAGHELHLFRGANGTSTFLQEIITDEEINLQWNSKWGQNDKSLTVLIFTKGRDGFEHVSNAQILKDPDGKYPWTRFSNPNKKEDGNIDYKKPFYLSVIHPGSTSETRPDVFKWIDEGSGNTTVSTDSDLGYYESTIYGHSAGANSANVGSVQYWSTPAYRADTTQLSQYSSWGRTPIYFDWKNNPLPEPEIRQNPAFVVPQKVDTTFFSHGYDMKADSDGDFFQNFEGTSAAAPNAAAVAALMLQLNPELTPSDVIDALKKTATPVQTYNHSTTDGNGFNRASGYGLINAMDALDYIAQLKLSGTVYEDTNADGKQNDGELGLEGIRVFLDSNGNGRFDQNRTWQSFLATASDGESSSAFTKPPLVVDEISGLAIDSRYETIIHGTDSLSSNTPFSERSLLISSITSSSDYDVITEGAKDLTLNGDLLLHFDGESRTTPGSYSILKANSISGSFDNILIEGLSDDLYFGIGIEGGDNIQVTVSEDYFVGSTQAGWLF